MPDAGYRYTPITAAAPTTTVIKAAGGTLKRITFNKPVATGVVTVYDNPSSAAGTVIATITTPASPIPVTLEYDLRFNLGCTIVSATAAQDFTVVWV